MKKHCLALVLALCLTALPGLPASYAQQPAAAPGGALWAFTRLWPVRLAALGSHQDRPVVCCRVDGTENAAFFLLQPGENGAESTLLFSRRRDWFPDDPDYGMEQGVFYLTGDRVSYKAVRVEDGLQIDWYYRTLLEQDDYRLEAATPYAPSGGETIWTSLYRLTLPDGSVRRLSVETRDLGFRLVLENYPYIDEYRGPTGAIALDWDPATLTATLDNTKLTYTLCFADGTVGLEHRYGPELTEQAVLRDRSPSGEKALYMMDPGGMGDAFWGDLVLYTGGEYRYCCPDVGNAVFLGEDRFAAWGTLSSTITLYDAETLEQLPPLPGLQFEEMQVGSWILPSRRVLGWTYDSENELFLVATREEVEDGDMFDLCPVTLLVLDSQGQRLRELDAGLSVYRYYKNYPEGCTVTCRDGVADIASVVDPDRRRGSVAYLEG